MLLFLAGCSAASGALLVLAGTSKVYRGARGLGGLDGDSAIRRALRIPRRRWRRVEFGVGVLECVVGVIVCAGVWPVLGGAALATLGAAFCAALGYARARRVPGGCGCITWRPAGRRTAERVSWLEIARSAVLLGVGVAGALLLPGGSAAAILLPSGGAAAASRAWFGGGLLFAAAVLALLSLNLPLRTPACHRPFWRPSRVTLRALTAHPVFAAMAESAGPFGAVARHHRSGCTEEFWFPVEHGSDVGRAVVFRVRYAAGDGTLAVQASLASPGPLPTTITHDLSSYKP